jgi:hypothetical protein
MTWVNIHTVLNDYSAVKCQNILQLFTVNSTTQSLCTCSMGLILCSQFAAIPCHFYYTVTS